MRAEVPFVCAAFDALLPERIKSLYDFGSYITGSENLRKQFPNRQYVGVDFRDGPGVDLVHDLTKVEWDHPRAQAAVSFDTLEHVWQPFNALKTISLALEEGAPLLVLVPFTFQIHCYPDDYFRYTPQGLRTLLEWGGFTDIALSQKPPGDSPSQVWALGWKGHRPDDCSGINLSHLLGY